MPLQIDRCAGSPRKTPAPVSSEIFESPDGPKAEIPGTTRRSPDFAYRESAEMTLWSRLICSWNPHPPKSSTCCDAWVPG